MNPAVFKNELENIVGYWITWAVDTEHGGFYGRINSNNLVDRNAPKGAVLNARILWTFSAAFLFTGNSRYLEMAERSFGYIEEYFIDKEHGSVYWSLHNNGAPLHKKKQTYALAFAIYGLSEYYRASGNRKALDAAVNIYHDIEKYSFDPDNGGYLEAFTEDWKELPDQRLSTKDSNEKKTANTHLHILEAYTNLYGILPDQQLKHLIKALLTIFLDHFIDPVNPHLVLFLDECWQKKSSVISYGHDIEASWLLWKAAVIVGDKILATRIRANCLALVRACSAALDTDGSMFYEFDENTNAWQEDKHWWVQAEAMIGFFNAWQLTGEKQFYEKFSNVWKFTPAIL